MTFYFENNTTGKTYGEDTLTEVLQGVFLGCSVRPWAESHTPILAFTSKRCRFEG